MTNLDFQVTGFLHGIKYDVEIACAIIYAVCIFYSCVGGIKVKYICQTDTRCQCSKQSNCYTIFSCELKLIISFQKNGLNVFNKS